MRSLFHCISCLTVFITFHGYLHSQFRIHSYGLSIANSINGISVGYQNFEAIGMKTNFISKGQPEFSLFNPMIGISLIAEYEPIFLMGRISLDDRSGIIEDENMPGSLIMHPNLSYLTFESALMIHPLEHIAIYGGPSLSFLLSHSIGKLGDNLNENQLSNMNTLIPGLFAGISAEYTTGYELLNQTLNISPFLETSLIFNQRRGEFPENQDSFDNIWSTFSIRAGFSIHVNKSKESPYTQLPFSLNIPSEMAGKRAMKEFVPLLMKWNMSTFRRVLSFPKDLNLVHNHASLCTKSDPLYQYDDVRKQRICIEDRSVSFLMHHLKESSDTCMIMFCSNASNIDLQNTVEEVGKQVFRIIPSRIRFERCMLEHLHTESVKATLSSNHIPIIEMEFSSISPPENVINCSLNTPDIPHEWFIDIAGPQQYKKTYGPFTDRTVHLDGSELLQGEAGAGAYQLTIRYAEHQDKKHSFSQDFNIHISSENKMQGHSITYLPQLQNDSSLKAHIIQDIRKYLRPNDEIMLIIDERSTEEMRNTTREILEFINTEIKKLNRSLRKEISIIEKGRENALYDSTSDWGRMYEEGIRMEFIH